MVIKMEERKIRKTVRTEAEKKNLSRRLNVISGQVKGVVNMLNEDRYCDDILIQISAINSSLNAVAKEILKSHLETCVVKEIKDGNPEIINEVMDLFRRIE